jgi:hypothetical protein
LGVNVTLDIGVVWAAIITSCVSILLGGGSIICYLVKDHRDKQFEKQREKYRGKLENINYVNKIRYDIELGIIKDLTEKAFNLKILCGMLFPSGLIYVPQDKTEHQKLKVQQYNEAMEAYNLFIRALGKSAAFINDDIFEMYEKFRIECGKQIRFSQVELYNNNAWNLSGFVDEKTKGVYDRNEKMIELNNDVNKKIKEYLKTLRVEDWEK